nr:unnamed protein product [Callosobruchus chinensis]
MGQYHAKFSRTLNSVSMRYILHIGQIIQCCRPRSGLFRLLDNRFLPPPAKVKQTVDDLVLDEGQFLDLPVNLALRLSTTLKDCLQMPYDYFCPMEVETKGLTFMSTTWHETK